MQHGLLVQLHPAPTSQGVDKREHLMKAMGSVLHLTDVQRDHTGRRAFRPVRWDVFSTTPISCKPCNWEIAMPLLPPLPLVGVGDELPSPPCTVIAEDLGRLGEDS